ncbi:MAG: hypothetical protein ACE15F_13160 [bacterium]
MSTRPAIQVLLFDSEGNGPLGSVQTPRKITLDSGFGAMRRRCWLELYNEDLDFPADLGSILEIWINHVRCFRGRVCQRRMDSIDDYLTLYAEFDPEHEDNAVIGGVFENQTVTTILNQVLTAAGLRRGDSFEQGIRFGRLEFAEYPLFPCIDLLAKLAGNWMWDIDEEGALSFRPPFSQSPHVLLLDKDRDTINLWETVTDISARVGMQGGIIGGVPFDQWIEIPGLSFLPHSLSIRVYVRPLASLDACFAFRRAVIQQMTRPHYEHYVTLHGQGETVAPGDCVRFLIDDYPLLPPDGLFRVKRRDIVYAHERLETRLFLTSGLESSPTYFHYFRHDRTLPPLYLRGKTGPFQLDVSALDSPAHLDPA